MPPTAFLFDLDMTLVDSSALDDWRTRQLWQHVRANMGQVKPFAFSTVSAHELPGRLKALGHRVAVVTSSPRWYAEQLLSQFGVTYDALVAYGDTTQHKPDPEPINAALATLGAAAEDAYHIGDAPIDVEASYHAGVASIGAGWGVRDLETFCSAAPDILVLKPSSLLKLDTLERRGYFAEVLSDGLEPKAHRGSILPCGGTPVRYALGRYFTASDPRHATSKLSSNLLTLKNGDGPASVMGRALGEFLKKIDWTPDYIVPVPPKPSQPRNRFKAVLEAAEPWIPEETNVYLDGLACVKEVQGYKAMGPLERAAAIRGVFASKYTWNNGRVLLLDDVLTTGETVTESARVLMANAVAEVRVVALGKDQQVFMHKQCPSCGRTMKVRTNSYTGEKFWGCSGYPDSCQYSENL
ncbi:MAG: HAD-IA family hydrolase [Myxococcales bacterium]|nr:HAD-IA family hydrolase [Myxococcales bacterium]